MFKRLFVNLHVAWIIGFLSASLNAMYDDQDKEKANLGLIFSRKALSDPEVEDIVGILKGRILTKAQEKKVSAALARTNPNFIKARKKRLVKEITQGHEDQEEFTNDGRNKFQRFSRETPIKLAVPKTPPQTPPHTRPHTRPHTPPRAALAVTVTGVKGESSFYMTRTPVKQVVTNGSEEEVIEIAIDERSVYTWVAVKDHYDEYIQPENLINVGELLIEDDWRNRELVDSALLHAEVQIRKWIRDNPRFLTRTLYVGLSEDVSRRVYSHRYSLLSYEKAFSSRKTRYADMVGDLGYNTRMRPLLYNIPVKLLPLFECLAARLFSAQLLGGSTLIGNEASWERLHNYWESSSRKDRLQSVKLDDVTEAIERDIFQSILLYGVK